MNLEGLIPKKLQAWRQKYWPIIRILGPLAVIFGIVQLIGIL